jgi:Fur family peroxide stress response transcriptional regulator
MLHASGCLSGEIMADPEVRLQEMLSKLKNRALRITPQRLAILRILALSDGHPSVEQIHEKVRVDFPTTSLATVYKNIALLKELGEALELGFTDGSNRYDGNRPYPHPHLVCLRCKEIIDPDLSSLADVTAELSQETGFLILSHRLDFFGICSACQSMEKQGEPAKKK